MAIFNSYVCLPGILLGIGWSPTSMVYTEGVRLEPVQSYWPHYFGQITDKHILYLSLLSVFGCLINDTTSKMTLITSSFPTAACQLSNILTFQVISYDNRNDLSPNRNRNVQVRCSSNAWISKAKGHCSRMRSSFWTSGCWMRPRWGCLIWKWFANANAMISGRRYRGGLCRAAFNMVE